MIRLTTAVMLLCAALAAHSYSLAAQGSAQRTFSSPEDAVRALIAAAKPGDVLALYCYDPMLKQRTLVTVGVE